MADEPTIDVEITARQRVTYIQRKSIPVSVFERYKKMCKEEARDSAFSEAFEEWIDRSDICDEDEMEDIEINPIEKR